MSRNFDLRFPFAHGEPSAQANFRTECEDFVVNEVLGFTPAGEGEHVLLEILKRDDNTPWIAKQIARLAGVQQMDVGYCGLKDRRAVTRQWFSVYLPAQTPINWTELNSDNCQVLNQTRHTRKLRRGEHQANQFIIRLRDCRGNQDQIAERLRAIGELGVPNYFGEQRFGRTASNLLAVDELLQNAQAARARKGKGGRRKPAGGGPKGMVLSAARSWLFNLVLAERVRKQCWRTTMAGEPDNLPTGPLWGRGRTASTDALLALETQQLAAWSDWCDGLEHAGLSQERRPLVLEPSAFSWRWEADDLVLNFTLPPGQFATSVLREVCRLHSPDTE